MDVSDANVSNAMDVSDAKNSILDELDANSDAGQTTLRAIQ